jgi:hypothetical protein
MNLKTLRQTLATALEDAGIATRRPHTHRP